MKFVFLLGPLFLLSAAGAQTFHRIHATVIQNDAAMLSPWAGGVNAPQWSAVDLNDDGVQDLYSFDRDGNVQLTYLFTGNPGEARYEFAPEFLAHFPVVHDYVLLRDYNQDGAMDLFAYSGDEGVPGFKVYKGRFEDGHLAFDRLAFPQFFFDVLTVTTGSGFVTNLEVNRLDYSAIDDLDNDGDLDILGIESSGGRQFVFYRNRAIEQGFTLDTLIFKKESNCWAGLSIPTLTSSLNLSVHPDSCAPVMSPMINAVNRSGGLHGAGSLCTFDIDNDGDKELLYGDLQFPQIIMAKNGGTTAKAWATSQDSTFPSYNVPVNLDFFPASYVLDMDHDEKKDLVVSPNTFGNVRDRNAVWYYRNTGSAAMPVFSKTSESLIEQDMIDVGTTAQPAFVDYNADGLMDFVVGNFSAWTPSTQPNDAFIRLYLNVGTETEPVFELSDNNLLNFNQYSAVASGFAPTFGDLDNDGDLDLLVGESSGTLFFVENKAGAGNPCTWGPVQPGWKGIDVGQNATPCIFDVNKDGLPDLLIGNHRGLIKYFPNQGSTGNPQFHPNPDEAPNNNFFGGISTQLSTTSTGYTAPVVLSFDTVDYVITGSEKGFIEVYILDQDLLDVPGGPFEIVSEQFGGLYEGTFSRISFANIDKDEYLDALVGNHRGGLSLFRSPFTVQGSVPAREALQELAFDVFPNPVSDRLWLQLPDSDLLQVDYVLFNGMGQEVLQGSGGPGVFSIDVSKVIPGMYFLRVSTQNQAGIKKVRVR